MSVCSGSYVSKRTDKNILWEQDLGRSRCPAAALRASPAGDQEGRRRPDVRRAVPLCTARWMEPSNLLLKMKGRCCRTGPHDRTSRPGDLGRSHGGPKNNLSLWIAFLLRNCIFVSFEPSRLEIYHRFFACRGITRARLALSARWKLTAIETTVLRGSPCRQRRSLRAVHPMWASCSVTGR